MLRKGEGDPLAELARLIGQTDPFATMGRANQPVRARASATSTSAPDMPRSEPRRGPPHGCSAPPMQRAAAQEAHARQDYPERRASGAAAMRTPVARAGAGYITPTAAIISRGGSRQPDPIALRRCAVRPASTPAAHPQHDPAYPTIPTPIRTAMRDERRRAGRKASRRHDDGGGRAGAGRGRHRRRLRLSHLCRIAAQRRAAGHQGRPRSDQDRAGAGRDGTGKRSRTAWRRRRRPRRWCRARKRRSIVNARRRGPRVVFPPLNQNANPPPPASVAPGGRRRPAPATARWRRRAAQDPDLRGPRRSAPMHRHTGRARRRRAKPRSRARRHRRDATAGAGSPRNAASRCRRGECAAVAGPQTPRARARRRREPARPQPTPRGRSRSGGGYLVQVSSQRTRPTPRPPISAAGQVPGGARIAVAADQARRSRRQGRLLPRHGRPVRLARRGHRSSAAT